MNIIDLGKCINKSFLCSWKFFQNILLFCFKCWKKKKNSEIWNISLEHVFQLLSTGQSNWLYLLHIPDVVIITSDFTTFAGVLSGIAVLSGLICFVLHLFNQNIYGSRHHRHRFGNANLAPPILFASDPGEFIFFGK